MKRLQEDLQNGELPKNLLIEGGGKVKFHGKGYVPTSLFHDVDIEIKNNRNSSIKLELKEDGLFIKLRKDQ